MKPTLVHGIILLFLSLAIAAFSKPLAKSAGVPGTGPTLLNKTDSALSVPENVPEIVPKKKPARAKPDKSAAPLAKPESGDEAESEESKEAEEDATDCDECVLASKGQVVVPPGLAQA